MLGDRCASSAPCRTSAPDGEDRSGLLLCITCIGISSSSMRSSTISSAVRSAGESGLGQASAAEFFRSRGDPSGEARASGSGGRFFGGDLSGGRPLMAPVPLHRLLFGFGSVSSVRLRVTAWSCGLQHWFQHWSRWRVTPPQTGWGHRNPPVYGPQRCGRIRSSERSVETRDKRQEREKRSAGR